jgi:hypothetical protein
MASKLSVYNSALLAIGERKLASLAETRPLRRRLDSVWDDNGPQFCLQQGCWNFALKTVELTYSPSVTPAFGYTYAFDKPTDWLRTACVSDDEQFINRRFDFEDQAAYWFANPETIYAKYVSKDTAYGMDLSLWTPNFAEYVAHHFATKICKVTTGSSTERDQLMAMTKRLLSKALTTDAMDESAQFLPRGQWSQSRRGNRGRSDGGSNSNLIG